MATQERCAFLRNAVNKAVEQDGHAATAHPDVQSGLFRHRIRDQPVDEQAARQRLGASRGAWRKLYETLVGLGVAVELMTPQPGLPDLVFTANAGLMFHQRFFSSRFRHEVRRVRRRTSTPGSPPTASRSRPCRRGCSSREPAMRCSVARVLFAGYRIRSDVRGHQHIASVLHRQVLPLELINPYFYHLDTCFCPLAPGERCT